MKRYFIIFAILSVGFYLTNPVQAQVGLNKLGQSTMNFLQVSVSPKGSSLGDAYTTIGTGAEAIFYNPAGLAQMKTKFEAIFTTTQWLTDIQYLAGAIAWNMGNVGTVAFSFLGVDYGDIYATKLISYEESSTHQLGYIDNGLMKNVGAYAFGLTYSKSISHKFLMGGSVRFIGQNLGESLTKAGPKKNKAQKLVFDFGLKYYTGFKSFCFGMSIRNFGTAVKYEEITAQLPLVFALGAAIDLMDFVDPDHSEGNTLVLASDFSHPNNYTERVNVGLEYNFMNLFSLRGGYQSNLDFGGFSAGFGLSSPPFSGTKVEFNYSFSKFKTFDNVNRFSFLLSF